MALFLLITQVQTYSMNIIHYGGIQDDNLITGPAYSYSFCLRDAGIYYHGASCYENACRWCIKNNLCLNR